MPISSSGACNLGQGAYGSYKESQMQAFFYKMTELIIALKRQIEALSAAESKMAWASSRPRGYGVTWMRKKRRLAGPPMVTVHWMTSPAPGIGLPVLIQAPPGVSLDWSW